MLSYILFAPTLMISLSRECYCDPNNLILILAALEQRPRVLLSSMTEIMGLTKCLHHPTQVCLFVTLTRISNVDLLVL